MKMGWLSYFSLLSELITLGLNRWLDYYTCTTYITQECESWQASQGFNELMIYGPAARFAVSLTFSMTVGSHCHPCLSE